MIAARRPRQTAERWRTRLSGAAGATFEVAGSEMSAVPTPERILELGAAGVVAASGMEAARAERVVAVAPAPGCSTHPPLRGSDLHTAAATARPAPAARVQMTRVPRV